MFVSPGPADRLALRAAMITALATVFLLAGQALAAAGDTDRAEGVVAAVTGQGLTGNQAVDDGLSSCDIEQPVAATPFFEKVLMRRWMTQGKRDRIKPQRRYHRFHWKRRRTEVKGERILA